MEKPVEWVWYGRDNDGESHISLGRWKRHSCQMRYKLAEIQPTEYDRAIPTIDPAAIREAALREAAAKCAEHAEAARKKLGAAQTREEAVAWALIVTRCDLLEDAILALIGEKK